MKKRKLTANAYIPTRFFVGASGEAMESAVSPRIHPLGAAALLGRGGVHDRDGKSRRCVAMEEKNKATTER